MKLWRAGLGAFLAAFVLACGGQAEGGEDPLAAEPTRPAAPSAPPPAYRGNAAPPPAASSAPDQALPLDEGELRQQVAEAMLGKYCGRCHGAEAVANDTVMGGFDFVDDIDELVRSGYIIPTNPAISPLLQRIRNGDMPPAGVRPRPTQNEIRALEAYLDPMRLF